MLDQQIKRLSSTQGHIPPKVVFYQRSSSTKGCLPLNVIFHQRSSSTQGHLPPKVVFHWRCASTKGCLPPKGVLHQRCPPPKVTFHWRLFFLFSGTYLPNILIPTFKFPCNSTKPSTIRQNSFVCMLVALMHYSISGTFWASHLNSLGCKEDRKSVALFCQ